MEKICSKIIYKLIAWANISCTPDDIEMYTYGLACFLYTTIPSFCLIIASLFVQQTFEILFWIFTFLTLRKFAGGIHSKTVGRCFIFSTLLGLTPFLLCPMIDFISHSVYFLCTLINMFLLLILAPATKKAFSLMQRKLCKVYLGLFVSIVTSIIYFVPFLQSYYLHALFSTVILCIAQKIEK